MPIFTPLFCIILDRESHLNLLIVYPANQPSCFFIRYDISNRYLYRLLLYSVRVKAKGEAYGIIYDSWYY